MSGPPSIGPPPLSSLSLPPSPSFRQRTHSFPSLLGGLVSSFTTDWVKMVTEVTTPTSVLPPLSSTGVSSVACIGPPVF